MVSYSGLINLIFSWLKLLPICEMSELKKIKYNFILTLLPIENYAWRNIFDPDMGLLGMGECNNHSF